MIDHPMGDQSRERNVIGDPVIMGKDPNFFLVIGGLVLGFMFARGEVEATIWIIFLAVCVTAPLMMVGKWASNRELEKKAEKDEEKFAGGVKAVEPNTGDLDDLVDL